MTDEIKNIKRTGTRFYPRSRVESSGAGAVGGKGANTVPQTTVLLSTGAETPPLTPLTPLQSLGSGSLTAQHVAADLSTHCVTSPSASVTVPPKNVASHGVSQPSPSLRTVADQTLVRPQRHSAHQIPPSILRKKTFLLFSPCECRRIWRSVCLHMCAQQR